MNYYILSEEDLDEYGEACFGHGSYHKPVPTEVHEKARSRVVPEWATHFTGLESLGPLMGFRVERQEEIKK